MSVRSAHTEHTDLPTVGSAADEPHRVTRTFAALVLLRRREPIARVLQIAATVGEAQAAPVVIETSTGEIAWMLADTLTGSHIWFAADGRIWQTPN